VSGRRRGGVTLLLGVACALLAADAEAGRTRPAIECIKPSTVLASTWAPLAIELSLAATAEPASLAVTLNGTSITSQVTVAPPSGGRQTASAKDVWGGIVLPGANTLTASVVKQGQTHTATCPFQTTGDAYADSVTSYTVGPNGGYPGTSFLPGVVIGPPEGAGLFQGGLDVFSLGFGGQITLRFDDNVIVNGPGDDFTVFENAFLAFNGATLTIERPFADPAIVAVSQDGVTWFSFACSLTTNPALGIFYPGCAGVYPVLSNANDATTPHAAIQTQGTIADLIGQPLIPPPTPGGAGGDSFDLADVGLSWARYVRITDANFLTGDPFGPTNAGADVDAVAAIHSVPATDANGNGVPDQVE
jgi:hypothetical protein